MITHGEGSTAPGRAPARAISRPSALKAPPALDAHRPKKWDTELSEFGTKKTKKTNGFYVLKHAMFVLDLLEVTSRW